MQLSAVHIKEFKSVWDSTRVEIGDVTCLVGKNEAGKTALLEAIYRLNPVVEGDGKFDVTDDYPRSKVEDYQQDLEDGKREHATIVTAEFTLTQSEIDEIEASYGKGVLKSPKLTLSKGYQSETLSFQLDVDEAVATKALVANANLPEALASEAISYHSCRELKTFLDQKASEQTQAVNEATTTANAIADEQAKSKALLEAKSLGETKESRVLRDELAEIAKSKGLDCRIWNAFLKKCVPKFLYFDEYYQMEGHLNIEQLKEREAKKQLLNSDRPMLGLIELARLNLDQLLNPQRTEELVNKLEGASNHLSQKILKYWSQNKHLQVKFDVRPARPNDPEGMRSGTNLWGRVHDSIHMVSTRLGTRSRGFIWFFSFLAWFATQRKHNQPMILLLDEPGLFLHARAQGDLLRFIEEELKPHHQVIYTTHSPFLVDSQNFERVRIVEDRSMDGDDRLSESDRGTTVFTDVLHASEGTLFPLQGALGYDIAQSLFVGPNCLIVEGVSDLLFIQTISGILEQQGRTGLSQKWTLTPVGGADKVPTFCALLGAQKGLTVATLIDRQRKDLQKIENIYKQKLLKKNHVLTFADFSGKDESDIEDMFDADFYLSLVNAEYSNQLSAPILQSALPGTSTRIVQRLEQYFAAKPLGGGATFNHYRPARLFAERAATLVAQLSADTLQRFEQAFQSLNALL